MISIYRTNDNRLLGLSNTKDSNLLLKEKRDILTFLFTVAGRTNRLDLHINYEALGITEEAKQRVLTATEYIKELAEEENEEGESL